jgi:hypothetical protein
MHADLPTNTLAAAAALQDYLSCTMFFCCLSEYNGRLLPSAPHSLDNGLQR